LSNFITRFRTQPRLPQAKKKEKLQVYKGRKCLLRDQIPLHFHLHLHLHLFLVFICLELPDSDTMRFSNRFTFNMPAHVVIILILATLSPFPQANAEYFIKDLSIGEPLCNTDLVAGTMVSVAWAVDNISGTGNDTCWLAIRPTWNTVDDNAYANGVHVRCSFTSTNIYIPLAPFDKDLPYNGSSYAVRLISPAPNNIMLDSCSFL
jgi:hypothetical protein